MKNKIIEYIYPILSSSIDELYTHTTISEFELTSTQIVVAGLSISVVTMILFPLISKRYSNKRERVFDHNMDTLIEEVISPHLIKRINPVMESLNSVIEYLYPVIERLNPSKFDLRVNPIFKRLAEHRAILENQRAIEISLSNNSNRILAEQMAILVDQRAIEISISNSSNRTLEKEAVYTISDNNEEINSSILEPFLFRELPCLNNSNMEALLKEMRSEVNKNYNTINRYEYLLDLLRTSIYENVQAEKAYSTVILLKKSRFVSLVRRINGFTEKEILYILTQVENYFSKELNSQYFRLNIDERSLEHWFLCYTENQTIYNMSEDEAAEKATESWKEYYQNLSNSEEIILSFDKIKTIPIDDYNFKDKEQALKTIESLKDDVIEYIQQAHISRNILEETELYYEEFYKKVHQSGMDDLKIDSEAQIPLNTNNLDNAEDQGIQNLTKEDIKIILTDLKTNIISKRNRINEELLYREKLSDRDSNVYEILKDVFLNAHYQLNLAKIFKKILHKNNEVIIYTLQKKFNYEIASDLNICLKCILRMNVDSKKILFLDAKADLDFYYTKLKESDWDFVVAENEWLFASKENIIVNLESDVFMKKFLDEREHEHIAELTLSQVLKNFSAADAVTFKRNLAEILFSIYKSSDQLKPILVENVIAEWSSNFVDTEHKDSDLFSNTDAFQAMVRMYFNFLYDAETTLSEMSIEDLISILDFNINIT